jgi:hypothetical protein
MCEIFVQQILKLNDDVGQSKLNCSTETDQRANDNILCQYEDINI